MIDEAGSIERDRVEQPTISNEEAAVVASAAVISADAVMDEEEKVWGPEDKTACLTSMTSMDGKFQLYQLTMGQHKAG
jgi:hypothetical protein